MQEEVVRVEQEVAQVQGVITSREEEQLAAFKNAPRIEDVKVFLVWYQRNPKCPSYHEHPTPQTLHLQPYTTPSQLIGSAQRSRDLHTPARRSFSEGVMKAVGVCEG